MPRVLIGDFGAIARLGLREFLDEEGFDLVAEEGGTGADVLARLTEVRPDVVVIDLDDEDGLANAERIVSEFPAVKVIACSSREPKMRVFPPFHHGESYLSPLSRTLLAETVRG